jgi:DNA modification methylase
MNERKPIEYFINKIINGHVLDILRSFPDECIDVIVTSPPYWGLRNYGEDTTTIWGGNVNCKHQWSENEKFEHGGKIGMGIVSVMKKGIQTVRTNSQFCVLCSAWKGQLGLEPHPQMFIDHLILIFREIKRVLKSNGSLWLNMGDTYCGSGVSNKDKWTHKESIGTPNKTKLDYNGKWLQPKQLLMIPERIAIAMQEDGWILRNKVVWYKPNHMPSSVKDRLSSSYEFVYLFVKSKKYYFDLDLIRQSYIWAEKDKRSLKRRVEGKTGKITTKKYSINAVGYHPLGKNPADVWKINTQPSSDYWCPNCKQFVKMENLKCVLCGTKVEAHFATYPEKLVEQCLKASCPQWICRRCGKPRTRIIKRTNLSGLNPSTSYTANTEWIKHGTGKSTLHTDLNILRETIGWTDCGCGIGFESGIVLDPFVGSGTTCKVAQKLGLNYIGIDIKKEYCEMASVKIGNCEIIKHDEKTSDEQNLYEQYSKDFQEEPQGLIETKKEVIQTKDICPKCGSKMFKGKHGYYCTKASCDGRTEI